MELTIAFSIDDTYLAIFGTILAVVSVAVLSWIVAPDYEEAFFPIEEHDLDEVAEPTTAALVANGGTESPAGRLSISPPHVAFSFAPNLPVAPQAGPTAPNPPAPGPGIFTVAVPVTTISVAPIAPPPSQLARARQIIAEQHGEIGDLRRQVDSLSSSLGASARMRNALSARLTAQQQAQAVPTIPARLYNTTGTQTEIPPVTEQAVAETPSEQPVNTTHDSATQTEGPTYNDATTETIDDVPVTRDDVTVLSNADLTQWQDTQIAAQDQIEALQTRVRELEARIARAGPVTSLPQPHYTGHIASQQRTCDQGHHYTAYSQDDTCLECGPCAFDEDFDNEPAEEAPEQQNAAAADNGSSTNASQAAKPDGKGKGVDTVEHPNYHAPPDVPQQTATTDSRLTRLVRTQGKALRKLRREARMLMIERAAARQTLQATRQNDMRIEAEQQRRRQDQETLRNWLSTTSDVPQAATPVEQTGSLLQQQQPVQGLGITMTPNPAPAAAPSFEADNGMQLDRDDDVKMGSPESQNKAHAPTANEQPEPAAQQGGDGNFQAEQNGDLPALPNAPQGAAPTYEADARMEQGENDDMAIDSPVLPGQAGAQAVNEQAGPPVQQEGDGGNGFPATPNAERATTPVFAPELDMENAWDPNDPPPGNARVPDTPPQAAAPTRMGLPAGGLRLPGLQHGPPVPTANDVAASPRQPVANHNGIPGQYQLPTLQQGPAAPAVPFAPPNNMPPPGNAGTAATAPTSMFGRPAANPNGGQAAPPGLPAPVKRPGGAIPTGLFFGGSSANPPRKDATSNVAQGASDCPINPLQGPGAVSTLQAGGAGPARPVTAQTNIFAAAAALDGLQAPVVNHNGIPGQHALPSLGLLAPGTAPNDVPANPVQPGANNGEPPAPQQQPLGRVFGPQAPAENAGATVPPQFVFAAPNPGLNDRQAAQLEADIERQLAADGDTDAAPAQIPAPPNPQPEFAMGFVPGAGRPVPGRATGPPQRRRLGRGKAKAKEDTLQEALEKDPNAPGDDFEM
ncbi:hypothetical protein LTR56_021959 [Elasticomyces elasticus]|nr:hypothetical protein LTR56_021959 [Elasticomyces elasticus]KAK3629662.1 hypothetical protein LTR22_021832 [Elasticomyces elasticus]KAK4911261.1 hypothetical protein LTR49_020149 [Elasticomyces elasticus]KAK5756309.1 hypothetical protein LTS12_013615 [Elasticomyces elasticus]